MHSPKEFLHELHLIFGTSMTVVICFHIQIVRLVYYKSHLHLPLGLVKFSLERGIKHPSSRAFDSSLSSFFSFILLSLFSHPTNCRPCHLLGFFSEVPQTRDMNWILDILCISAFESMQKKNSRISLYERCVRTHNLLRMSSFKFMLIRMTEQRLANDVTSN